MNVTTTEAAILALLDESECLTTTNEIARKALGYPDPITYTDRNVVRRHICNMRQKDLEIESQRHRGYKVDNITACLCGHIGTPTTKESRERWRLAHLGKRCGPGVLVFVQSERGWMKAKVVAK